MNRARIFFFKTSLMSYEIQIKREHLLPKAKTGENGCHHHGSSTTCALRG